MTVALALLGGALAVGWFLPAALRWVDLRRCDPVPLIVVWFVSAIGTVGTAAAGIVLLLVPGHGPVMTLVAALHRCWSALRHGSPLRVEELAGLFGVLLLIVFVGRLLVVVVRGFRERSRKRQENLAVLRLAGRRDGGSPETLWLTYDRPIAFSMAGRPGVVVVTEGLRTRLDPAAVGAVLAHERAHLSGRHHLLLAAAGALRGVVGFVPLFRRLPQAIRELVELAADVVAVRSCGAAAVRTALFRVSGQGTPDSSLAMAQDAVGLRLARLRSGYAPPGKLRRTFSCWTAGAVAGVLPLATGTGLLLGSALAVCPLGG